MSDDLRDDGLRAEPALADERLTDPSFLVNAAPGRVTALLDAASGPAARLAAAVYRASAHLHREATAGTRRQVLALDAARYGDRELSAQITAVAVQDEPAIRWGVEWATGSLLDSRLRLTWTGRFRKLTAPATAVIDGRTCALTSDRETGETGDTVRIWDLATGEQISQSLTGHGGVCSMATAVADGRACAVTGGDGTVRTYDLITGEQVGPELVFPLPVHAVAVAPDDRLVVGFGREVAMPARR
ncbi:hypothetical protein [Streptosporangium sp. NPDC000396]|uniref:hypothetical protein n=1 Tax=Streptosporangium sp. NPDC000396 TaxID=3366185 RepID=UPI0036CCA36C